MGLRTVADGKTNRRGLGSVAIKTVTAKQRDNLYPPLARQPMASAGTMCAIAKTKRPANGRTLPYSD